MKNGKSAICIEDHLNLDLVTHRNDIFKLCKAHQLIGHFIDSDRVIGNCFHNADDLDAGVI